MNYLIGEFYVEVKYHRYIIHPTQNIILRKRDPPTSLRTQYQVQKNNQISKIQEVFRNDNDELEVKYFPKNKQSITQQRKFKPPKCPSYKQNI